MITLPETNIEPENGRLEDEFPFWDAIFEGAMLVSGSVRFPTSTKNIFGENLFFKWPPDFQGTCINIVLDINLSP